MTSARELPGDLKKKNLTDTAIITLRYTAERVMWPLKYKNMTILVEKAEITSKKYKLILFVFTAIFSAVRFSDVYSWQ